MDRTREQIAKSIIKFAELNKLRIHPGRDPYTWADQVLIAGGCPCVPGRPSCPCAFVKEDMEEFGRCRCGLFASDTYMENYNALKGEVKKKRGKVEVAPVFALLPAMNDKARGGAVKED